MKEKKPKKTEEKKAFAKSMKSFIARILKIAPKDGLRKIELQMEFCKENPKRIPNDTGLDFEQTIMGYEAAIEQYKLDYAAKKQAQNG